LDYIYQSALISFAGGGIGAGIGGSFGKGKYLNRWNERSVKIKNWIGSGIHGFGHSYLSTASHSFYGKPNVCLSFVRTILLHVIILPF